MELPSMKGDIGVIGFAGLGAKLFFYLKNSIKI